MTIGFSTHWPKSMGSKFAGQANNFTNKIIKCCWQNFPKETSNHISNQTKEDQELFERLKPFGELSVFEQDQLCPKLHSFRADPSDRWKVGMKIHPVINNRTKNRFQFAPELEVKSIQKVEIVHFRTMVTITVDGSGWTVHKNIKGKAYSWHDPIETIAKNDGFDSVDQFLAWFNKDFKGKIIHWTDLKY